MPGKTPLVILVRIAVSLVFLTVLALLAHTVFRESAAPPRSPAPGTAGKAADATSPPSDTDVVPGPAARPVKTTGKGAAPGHSRPDRAWLRHAFGPVPSPANIADNTPVEPGALCLLGKVKDSEGLAVVDALVMVESPRGRSETPAARRPTTRSRADGSFVLGPLDINRTDRYWRSRTYKVGILAPGYYPEVATFRLGQERDVVLDIPGSLGGRVVQEGRQCLPCNDARVTATGPLKKAREYHETRTDVDGNYRFPQLRTGCYLIEVQPVANPAVAPTHIEVRSRQHTDASFAVKKGICVRGRVTEMATGHGLANVRVFTAATVRTPVMTGPDGKYVVAGLPRTTTLQFNLAGFLPVLTHVKAADDEEEKARDVTMARPGTIHGVVLTPDNKPTEYARVEFLDERVMTDAEGKFTFEGVWPDRNLRVRAHKMRDGFGWTKSEPFTVGDGQVVTGIVIRLEPEKTEIAGKPPGLPGLAPRSGRYRRTGVGIVSGRVENTAGAAIAGASVGLYRSYRFSRFRETPPVRQRFRYTSFQAVQTKIVGENGEFRFDKLPPGHYYLGVKAHSFLAAQTPVFEIAELGTFHEVVTLKDGFPVDFQFMDNAGKPLPHASVSAYREGVDFVAPMRGRTDGEGRARLGLFGEEYVQVRAYQPGRRFEPAVVRLQRDRPVTVQLRRTQTADPGTGFSGQVVFADTGAPVPVFRIRLQCGSRKLARQFADATGRFTWNDLAEGTYQVEAGNDTGWVSGKAARVDIVADTPTAPVLLRLYEGGRVDGVVRGPGGKPLAGARVTAHRGHRFSRPVAETMTNPAGAFHFKGLSRGEHFALAAHDLWVENWRRFTIATGRPPTVSITLLAEGGTLDITARDHQRRPVKDVVVYIYRMNGGVFVPALAKLEREFHRKKAIRPALRWGPFFNAFFNTDAHGRLCHPFLPPGRYQVRGNTAKMESDLVEVNIFDGAVTAARLLMRVKAEIPDKQ